MDPKLRQYLLGVAVSLVMALEGCYGKHLTAQVDRLDSENADRKVENATIKQDLKDFRGSFEEFKRDYKHERGRRNR